MAAKKSKLENQFKEEAKFERENAETLGEGGIFQGVAIYVNGYTGIVLKQYLRSTGPLCVGSGYICHFSPVNLTDGCEKIDIAQALHKSQIKK